MDVTERKQAEEELRAGQGGGRGRQPAPRTSFLATLSHELRTPLTPVLAVVSGLEGDAPPAGTCADRLAMIRRNVELEARLIDDLLDLTRIARGKLELQPPRRPTCAQVLEHAIADLLRRGRGRRPARRW